MQTKKTLLTAFIKSNRKVVIASFLFGFLSIVAIILIPVFLGKYYEVALHRHSTRGKMFDVLFGHVKSVEVFFLVFVALILVKFITDFLMKYFLGITGELLAKNIRERLFFRQLNSKLEVHQKKETGLYLLRYSGDLSAIQHYLTKGIITFFNDCLHLILAIIVLALLNVKLTLVLLASYPVIFITILYLNKRLKVLTGKRRNKRSNNLSFVSSRLNALLTIKAFNRQSIENEKYRKGSTELFEYGKKYYKLYSLIYALLPFMLYSMLALILWIAYDMKNHSNHKIHGHDLLTFIMTMVNVIPVLKRILSVNFIWQAGDISFTKLLRVYNARQEVLYNESDKDISSGSVEFRNVSFAFSKGATIIKDLSFNFPSNSLVLITGGHQSGKSTLFKLITGLYEAKEGEVLIGKTDIKEYSKLLLRKKITILSDEFPLIGKSVFETISYSRKEEKRAPAFQMLQKLGYVKGTDDESVLDEPIFENGKNISYSQRKILMLARALLTNKKILLLDEPFEGLDEVLIQKIVAIIEEYRVNHTVLIIDRNQQHALQYDVELQLVSTN
jgi:ABC-type bacteriocin/lantibiotic exporter with double-glycine peptidase domain